MSRKHDTVNPYAAPRKTFKHVLLWIIAFSLATITAFLSFVSTELAICVLAVSSFGFMAFSERTRRQHWEQAADFKFKRFQAKYNTLLRAIVRNTDAIQELKWAQAKSNKRSAMHEISLQKVANKAAAASPEQQKAKRAKSYYELIKDIQADSPAHEAEDSIQLPQEQPFRPKKQRVTLMTGTTSSQKFHKSPSLSQNNDIFEQRPSKVIIIDHNHDGLSDMVIKELTRNAIRDRDLEIFMQPIVPLTTRKSAKLAFPNASTTSHQDVSTRTATAAPYFHEVFSSVRARPGTYITASRYQKAVKIDDIHAIDTICLQKTIEKAQKTPKSVKFFINFQAETFKNKDFMDFFLPFIKNNSSLLTKLVFEIKQSEFHSMSIPLLQVMRGLAKIGCVFALDQMQNLNEDISDLQSLNIRYLKIDAHILATAKKNDRQFKEVMRAKRQFEGNGISMIATRIQDEDMLSTLADYKLLFGQGHVFGEPALDTEKASSLDITLQRKEDEHFIQEIVRKHTQTDNKTGRKKFA